MTKWDGSGIEKVILYILTTIVQKINRVGQMVVGIDERLGKLE